jgi:hypothetical protein
MARRWYISAATSNNRYERPFRKTARSFWAFTCSRLACLTHSGPDSSVCEFQEMAEKPRLTTRASDAHVAADFPVNQPFVELFASASPAHPTPPSLDSLISSTLEAQLHCGQARISSEAKQEVEPLLRRLRLRRCFILQGEVDAGILLAGERQAGSVRISIQLNPDH